MQTFRLNKESDKKTKVVIISHLDLDGIMSAYACDKAVRGVFNLTEDEVQVVGEFSPEAVATKNSLKQVLYKLKYVNDLHVFILDRCNLSCNMINELESEGWIKSEFRITCIDHHKTNFKPDEYINSKIKIDQLVDISNSAAWNVYEYFKDLYKFSEKDTELLRLTSIYDRFAWITEDISLKDELNAKYLNKVSGSMNRLDFIDFIESSKLADILSLGSSISTVQKMFMVKMYKDIKNDPNDFLLYKFKTEDNEERTIVFIRKSIEYTYVSEFCEYIFTEEPNIHVICLLDGVLGQVSLRSRNSGEFLDLGQMISELELRGGGHPGAAGYYAQPNADKQDMIQRLYETQSLLIDKVVSDVTRFTKWNFEEGKEFYGMANSVKETLELRKEIHGLKKWYESK